MRMQLQVCDFGLSTMLPNSRSIISGARNGGWWLQESSVDVRAVRLSHVCEFTYSYTCRSSLSGTPIYMAPEVGPGII
jgi:serine/threonine protein kinase